MEKNNMYELTNPQKSIWLTEQYFQDTTINNICGSLIIKQNTDLNLLNTAINLFIQNNDSFQLRFKQTKENLLQYFAKDENYNFEILPIEKENQIEEFAKKMVNNKIDLFNSRIFDFKLFKLSSGFGGFIVNVHHIISDAATFSFIGTEIVQIYSQLLKNEKISPKNYSYIDFIHSEEEYLKSSRFEKDKAFWQENLTPLPEVATIPSVRKTNHTNDYRAKREELVFDHTLVSKIRDFCTANQVSIFNFLTGIYSIYIGRVNHMENFLLGTPILNRTNYAEKHTSGMFISTSLLKIDLSQNISFTEFVQNIAKTTLSMLRHQKYNYQHILDDIRKKDKNISELYDIGLSYQITKATNLNSDIPYSTKWYGTDYIANSLDIHFHDNDNTGNLLVEYDYQIGKLDDYDIKNMHNRILTIINQVLENQMILIDDIEILTKDEKNRILNKFNHITADFPTDKTLLDLFHEQVSKNPHEIAVIFKHEKLTYEELDKKSNQMAKFLIQNHKISSNSIISVCMDRNINFIITILGILKTGCSYLPIHPDYPIDRIRYIVDDSHSVLMITDKEMNIPNCVLFDTIKFNQFSDVKIDLNLKSSSLAYVIYTSGSTGAPKGVLLTHRNLINFLYSFNATFTNKFSTNDHCLSITNISFDVSVCELFTPIIFGATLVLYEENTLTNLNLLVRTIIENKITFMYIPPNILQTLYEALWKEKSLIRLNKLLVGVESIKNSTLKNYYHINKDIEIINGYGPTETTICCTFYKFNPSLIKNNDDIVPIGKPLINNNIFILNKKLHMQPIYIPGELYVCGKNVSNGYLGKPELTAKSFVNIHHKIFYKTGDLGYFDEEGNIHFLGRNDFQVKIRGHRVELGEITNTLKKLNKIENAFSMVSTVNQNPVICSYVVLKKNYAKDFTKDAKNSLHYANKIKDLLKTYLPYYMIPTYIIFIDKMPINLNGKIDKSKLPEIDVNKFSTKIILPSTDTEKFLQEQLIKILNITSLSIEDNYFDLGADSLSCIKLIAEISDKLHIDIQISDLFKYNTIKTLANFIEKQKINSRSITITHCPKKDYYELSSAQKRIYYSSYILNSNSIAYNLPGGIFMDKIPNKKKLENCFHILIQRHESLRTYFEIEEGKPVQKIADKVNFNIHIITATDKNFDTYFHEFVKPFDLSKPPIIRVCLVIFADNTSLLLFDTHHILSDGTSMQILIHELCKLYNDEELEPISITYKDYSEWENANLKTDLWNKSKQYWLKQFQDEIPILNLPSKHPRPAKKPFKGAKIYKTVDTDLTNKINDFCKEHGITPYMLFLSAYYILLLKYSGQKDIVIGSPVIARENLALSPIIGMFVNTLPLRMDLNPTSRFYEFLASIKTMCLNSFKHQLYPFNEIVNHLNITRDASRNPLFDVLFTYQNNGNPIVHLKDIQTTYYLPDNKTSKFDLSLEITPEKDTFNLNFEYCTSLFTNRFIHSLSNHYLKILKDVLENPEIQISDIDMLSKKEKNKILIDFNQTEMDYPKEKSLVNLFEIAVKKYPSHTAVEANNKKISYQELNEKSNTIALKLIENKKIKQGDIIGVYMKKSIELIISIWGILKAGCVYMPMFVDYPEDRLNYMLENSQSPIVLTNSSKITFSISTMTIPCFDKIENTPYLPNAISILPDDIAYVIYTSGSTGRPKGVKITHKCLNNYIHSFYQLFKGISDKDRFLASTNISFDVSIWELFLSILNGSTLVIYEEEIISNILQYVTSIIKNKITTLYIPPNILEEVYQLLKDKNKVKINKMLVGVEPIKRRTLNKFYEINPAIKIVNGYGPTETTICSTALEYEPSLKNEKIVSIGKPIGNTKIYIVDDNMHIVPIGVPGELYISGDGVGQGYIGNDTENRKNFVENIFNTISPKIYKTGDLAKWNYNGTISFIGRKDSQIKISGYRIELKEIDHTVMGYPSIFKCLTTVYKTKNKSYLITYFTADKKVNTLELISFLQSKLAFYMVPNLLIQLERFPLTVNGKINTKELPKPAIHSEAQYIPPKTDLEKTLCKIWQDLFGISKIGIEDNFFELGGDSLSAIKFQVEALNKNLNISYADIFTYPTIHQLAQKASNTILENMVTYQNYDYTKINHLLDDNDKKNIPAEIHLKPIKSVLLTGATGFLGAHILDRYFSSGNSGIVYCMVRIKNKNNPEQRLKDILHFYFGEKYDSYFGNQIKIVTGDISQKNFGLEFSKYENLANNIDIVINSAALVKHYGDYHKFYLMNVIGTKNVVEFCEKYHKKLYHISTTSVSGLGLPENNQKQVNEITYFSEKDLYKNQNLNNTYLQTKFEAEKIILEEVANRNLKATIFRMGNISNRYLDGKFQINATENAFVNRIKAILKLGVIQNGFKKHSTEFAPVDFCADAIIKLIQSNPKFTIFHIFNHNLISFVDLVKFINELNIDVKFVTDKEFSEKVTAFLKNPILKNEIAGIVTDLDTNKKFKIISNILMKADFSASYLKQLGFNWPVIDKEYITKYVEYFKQTNFFKF